MAEAMVCGTVEVSLRYFRYQSASVIIHGSVHGVPSWRYYRTERNHRYDDGMKWKYLIKNHLVQIIFGGNRFDICKHLIVEFSSPPGPKTVVYECHLFCFYQIITYINTVMWRSILESSGPLLPSGPLSCAITLSISHRILRSDTSQISIVTPYESLKLTLRQVMNTSNAHVH